MNAGYLVGKWVEDQLKSFSQQGVIQKLTAYVGAALAKRIVSQVVRVGATAAAGAIATWLGASGTIGGPIAAIVGFASGWL